MYQRAKVYKIECDGLTYYGSTCNTLTKRLSQHKTNYNLWLSGKHHYVTSFKLFEIENPVIVLVEDYPCDRKEQLYARERYYIENNDCVNKIVPGRTVKEYNQQNKDKIKEYNKDYREQNKDKIANQRKEYRENNQEKIANQKKEYGSKPWFCECCNVIIRRDGKSKHLKRKSHLQNVPN